MVELDTLIERCRRGDQLAWEALVRRFQSRIYGLAFHYVRDADAARDLAQDIFVRIYERLDRADTDVFVPWMLRVARNLCIDRLRRIRARPPAEDVLVDEGAELPDAGPGPDESWTADERKRIVYRAMGGLSEQAREMIVLKEIEGFSVQEISEMLDTPVGTVKSRSHRARIELARLVIDLDPSYAT